MELEIGTSASSPTFASIVALLNDRLIAAGRSPLGFLNPWLYSTASGAFNDVVGGSNPGCGTSGFEALEGWDPVSSSTVLAAALAYLLRVGYGFGDAGF